MRNLVRHSRLCWTITLSDLSTWISASSRQTTNFALDHFQLRAISLKRRDTHAFPTISKSCDRSFCELLDTEQYMNMSNTWTELCKNLSRHGSTEQQEGRIWDGLRDNCTISSLPGVIPIASLHASDWRLMAQRDKIQCMKWWPVKVFSALYEIYPPQWHCSNEAHLCYFSLMILDRSNK